MPEIKIKNHDALTIVGLKYTGKAEGQEIPALWGKLMTLADQIPQRDFSAMAAYGVSVMGADFEATMVFDYYAGFPVEGDPQNLPEGMVKYQIPAGQYAVITCPNLASISQAYDALYKNWLPGSDYVLDFSHGNICFELYGEDYNPEAGSEKFYIYAPVKAK